MITQSIDDKPIFVDSWGKWSKLIHLRPLMLAFPILGFVIISGTVFAIFYCIIAQIPDSTIPIILGIISIILSYCYVYLMLMIEEFSNVQIHRNGIYTGYLSNKFINFEIIDKIESINKSQNVVHKPSTIDYRSYKISLKEGFLKGYNEVFEMVVNIKNYNEFCTSLYQVTDNIQSLKFSNDLEIDDKSS